MPQYFFHLYDEQKSTIDEEGSTLPDLQSAIIRAVRKARSIISADVANGSVCLARHIEIENAETRECTVVTFREAIPTSTGRDLISFPQHNGNTF